MICNSPEYMIQYNRKVQKSKKTLIKVPFIGHRIWYTIVVSCKGIAPMSPLKIRFQEGMVDYELEHYCQSRTL